MSARELKIKGTTHEIKFSDTDHGCVSMKLTGKLGSSRIEVLDRNAQHMLYLFLKERLER